MRLSLIFACTLLLLFLLNPHTGSSIGYYPNLSLSASLEIKQFGKIKFKEDWIYKIENDKVVSVGTKAGYEKYSKTGLKLEEASFDPDGNTLFEATYTYDEWGREAQCLGLKDNHSYFNKWSYSFIENDKVLEKKRINTSSNNSSTIYHFDTSGNVIKEICSSAIIPKRKHSCNHCSFK